MESSEASENLTDWGKVGAKFDLWVPYMMPVTDALISLLDLSPGNQILDLACGTGEPGLTIASRNPNTVQVLGVDAAEGMVAAAQAKAERQDLKNISFRVMPAEKLSLADATFDRLVARFGLMLFEDAAAGLDEMFRVLKPGGKLALSVWHTVETWRILNWMDATYSEHLPPKKRKPVDFAVRLGGDGVLETMLRQAGFAQTHVEVLPFDLKFESFDPLWRLVYDSGVYESQFSEIPVSQHAEVKSRLNELANDFRSGEELVVPHTCLVAVAER